MSENGFNEPRPHYAINNIRPVNKQKIRKRNNPIIVFIALICMSALYGCSRNQPLPKPLPMVEPGGTVETGTLKEEEQLPEKPLPENGYGKFFFKRSKTSSKLKLVPKSGTQGNMVVKLEDWDTGKVICWFFVRDGKTVETSIPEGTYRFKIASGNKWYGEEHLFGRDASYSTITSSVKIPARTIYTLEMTPAIDGTLKNESMGAEGF